MKNDNNIDLEALINKIQSLEQSEPVFRKVLLEDINQDIFNKSIKQEDKIKGYRLQGEYGEKKFIKP